MNTICLHVLRICPVPRTSSYGMVHSVAPASPICTYEVHHRGDRAYTIKIHSILATVSTDGIHHPPRHQRRSTTSNSNRHHGSFYKVSTLFVLCEGVAVSARGEVVVVWRTPLTRCAHYQRQLECYLASPKYPLPG